MFQKVALFSLAAALGAWARYGLVALHIRAFGPLFPWGTLTVNTLACFLAGLLWAIGAERGQWSPETRAVLFAGFLGAFSTFSAFILETTELGRESRWALAAANLALQPALGFAGFFAGAALARAL